MSPLGVCCLLCYSANWLHISLMAYKFQTLPYAFHQHVVVTLDIDKWTYVGGVATEFERTGTL